MIKRKIVDELRHWAKKENRKPLILRGARQVGKTTAVEMFSHDFEQYIYLNLEQKADRDLFEQDLPVDKVLEAVFFLKDSDPDEKSTLLFIDEIHNSTKAVSMLRYLYEEAEDLFVVCAGSLLEVYLDKEQISFPVGRVEFLYMHPLTFEEYLRARNQKAVFDLFQSVPVPDYAHDKILELFHEYSLIGGMPEICAEYLKHHDLSRLAPIYESLLISYTDDAAKYASGRSMYQVIRHIIETSPMEAGKRMKFQGFGNSSYRSRESGEAFRILERSMLISLSYPVTDFDYPLIPNKKKSPRLQFLDTGLLNYYSGIQKQLLNPKDLNSLYRGRIAEHIVGQEILAKEIISFRKPVFWVRENSGASSEIDFILQYGKYPVPVEVKSGKTGRLRSLHYYMEHSKQTVAVRLYADKILKQEIDTPGGSKYTLWNLPYYLAGKIMDYLEYSEIEDQNT
ncbi:MULTISPECIES: ATP-binding protein [unclassified Oceanispirochaeta]|uniref:ATP-binding protein n=1 Tax=unclassified Oceanispirochaeta TaxID=2635722 RepID=UPI000E095464|nr:MULTISPECIES: AAA family ATPase [unclassified Oceanispirochaeta]MBF9014430.1 ATP-binding protein [Oceanispirochaeta sp. M2]NPD74984.1 ATP-binding protein [Oceanispirochaeta sp. M1]RDG29160.1 DUF4143 domain-containing protein [Oceanispirochaeta sp. M1]